MKKRIFSAFLACILAAAMLVLPASASGSSPESTGRADKLVSLHLFRGTADGYQLDRSPTRLQGLIMLIRLLGLEEDALACAEANPFTDVNSPYATYAYHNGITLGTGPSTFSPGRALSAKHYVTFLLRALGYDDQAGDFTFDTCLSFAAGLSMMTDGAARTLAGISMNRGDMVDLSYAALTCPLKSSSATLAEKLVSDGVFTRAEGTAAGVLGSGAGWTYTYTAYDNSTVTHAKKTVSTSTGSVTANVLTVNVSNPNVTVRSAMVNNTLGATAPFSSIVSQSGAKAVVNGNFFNSYGTFKTPIGHVMVDGSFLYGNSGLTSLGITRSGEVRVGRPAVFTRVKASDGSSWAVYEINTGSQGASVSTLYTPAYGGSVTLTTEGYIMTVSGGTITDYAFMPAGSVVSIPGSGFVVYMGAAYMSYDYNRTPVVGSTVTTEYFLQSEDPEGFVLDELVSIVSGAPRLVQDGAMVTTLEAGFNEARFTVNSSPRTAVGVNAAGKLLLVSTPSATIQQLRELMLSLGCVDAFNLDGGASCGMYYNGSYLATPGRELTVTLQVFVKE